MRVLKANEPPAHGRLGVLVSKIHLGCSESFTGGWGDYGSPNPDDNPDWQIESLSIARYKKGAVHKTCGDVDVLHTVDNTAYAVSDETDEVSDDASVVIGGS